MRLLVVALLIIAATKASPSSIHSWSKGGSKIINGDVSEKGKWPWQISMHVFAEGQWQHTCGGSLLNADYVLTAAHCVFFDRNPDNYKVKLGGFQQSVDDFEQTLGVSELIIHPDFSMFGEDGLPHDIALLKLAGQADLANEYISTVSLPDTADQDFAGLDTCWITGWGRDDRDTMIPSDVLQEKNVPVWTHTECEERYGWWLAFMPLIEEAHICTAGDPLDGDVHACHGDSGGPLQCDIGNGEWRVAGVASRTGSAECSKRPSVYTRVSTYNAWIREHVSGV